MKWQRAPEELKSLLASSMRGIECEKRIMFGYPAYFINRNMFFGIFESAVFARLSPAQIEAFESHGKPLGYLEPMKGRPMKDYRLIPPSIYSDPKLLKRVIEESAAYTRTLKPKQKKTLKKPGKT